MVSAIVVHEIYKLTLGEEGREVADHGIRFIEKDFKIIRADSRITKISAEVRDKYRIPMADSIIAVLKKGLEECMKVGGLPEAYMFGRAILARIYGDIIENFLMHLKIYILSETGLMY